MGAKIVLDTNVLVAAFGWKGPPHKIFLHCIDGLLNLHTSPALISELEKVLSYKKFQFSKDEIKEFVSLVIETAHIVAPAIALSVLTADQADNRVLECALASAADYIISGDKHLLNLHEFEAIKIVTPDSFLKLL
ncbi:MAG: putative toxin-antitoxin system toxin component, PIN family [Proteobacteria bacterium]|nr:putative toxin-antitoxin system toxin component, PIN family [Pseudomonadota bacterium]